MEKHTELLSTSGLRMHTHHHVHTLWNTHTTPYCVCMHIHTGVRWDKKKKEKKKPEGYRGTSHQGHYTRTSLNP